MLPSREFIVLAVYNEISSNPVRQSYNLMLLKVLKCTNIKYDIVVYRQLIGYIKSYKNNN